MDTNYKSETVNMDLVVREGLPMSEREYEYNVLVIYDCKTGRYSYPYDMSALIADLGDRPLFNAMARGGTMRPDVARELETILAEVAASDVPVVRYKECYIQDSEWHWKWFVVGFICSAPHETIGITLTDINDDIYGRQCVKQISEYDRLTGLFNRTGVCRAVDEQIAKGVHYAAVYIDIVRFKAVNDMFGMAQGDDLLIHISKTILSLLEPNEYGCRIGGDKFVVFVKDAVDRPEYVIDYLQGELSDYNLPFEITFNAGVCVSTGGGSRNTADVLIDRAVLAQSAVKGSYTERYRYFSEEMREDLLTEQEIVGVMATALAEKQFVVYYQPQYNHATGLLIGAEALVRWKHPEYGIVSPGIFIPIFEKNGFITYLDLYVFERVCEFIKECLDNGITVVPISTNFSRYDIFTADFVEQLEEIRTRHDVPVKYIRVEITESSAIGGVQHINEIIRKLNDCGYVVEMDDFGSGYSSLNVLKNVEMDMIKLDMQFLSEDADSMNKGGTIISAVVRMAKWLNMPIIAEGVETKAQADFLLSIGCDYIQGYYYSKPLPEEDYLRLVLGGKTSSMKPQSDIIETLDVNNFWNPGSQETLIFSNYVGGAAIFEYKDGKSELLRVNKKYLSELSTSLSEKELLAEDPFSFFDEHNGKVYKKMLEKAIVTGEEQECETWRYIPSSCNGDEPVCIRSSVRMIGKSGGQYLFYEVIRDVTEDKKQLENILDSEKRFQAASEHANIYYWEYSVATGEMRPCKRCMRDFGLTEIVENYPEPAIECGIIAPEFADTFRDWHRQIESGAETLEAVTLFTPERIPYRVRYTTEFDGEGRPVKAYGSATKIV